MFIFTVFLLIRPSHFFYFKAIQKSLLWQISRKFMPCNLLFMVGNDYSAFIPLVPWLLPTNSLSELDRYQKINYNNNKKKAQVSKNQTGIFSWQHFIMSFSAMFCLARRLPRQDTWTAQLLPQLFSTAIHSMCWLLQGITCREGDQGGTAKRH